MLKIFGDEVVTLAQELFFTMSITLKFTVTEVNTAGGIICI